MEMTREKLISILKSYSVSAIHDGMTYAYNNAGDIREVLTNKAAGELADLILKE